MALPEQYTPQNVQFRSEVERLHEAFGSSDLASMFGAKDEGRMFWRGQRAEQDRIMATVDGLLFDLEFWQGPPSESSARDLAAMFER